MKDYSVKVSVRNGRILRRMREAGIGNQAELARLSGVNVNRICQLVNLRAAPLLKDGTWAHGIEDIAAVLRCDPEDLFSEAQRAMALAKNTVEIEMDEQQVARLASPDAERDTWMRIETRRMLDTLPPREREALERTVMSGETLAEVAADFGVGQERIRQLQAKAIRRLKHPARSALSSGPINA